MRNLQETSLVSNYEMKAYNLELFPKNFSDKVRPMFIEFGMLFFSLFGSLQGSPLPSEASPSTTRSQEEIKQIDAQIEQLEDLQDKLRSSAQRNINNAMRWQFQNENYLDARRAWDRAASDKQKIQELQDQIDDLKARKQKIMQENGSKKSSETGL